MTLLSLNQVAKRINKPGNRQLVAFLIRRAGITPIRSANAIVIDEADMGRIMVALDAWVNRERLNPSKARSISR